MKNILIILQIIPFIIKIMREFEESIPESGAGSDKLASIKKILDALLDNSEALWPTLEKIIGIIVTLFNAKGAFTKTD
jgi:hypothetical protein